ncbi:UDP-N-acetylmuramate--alanine ligase [Denitrobacterium detoxificans]|uniref:UDP-N-acetylmuramate--L-alanine ligase n=1 Tax=Denitrobacterium detoxificans TaxID=79604 RepID=A0A172RYW1_9ACTN|nr:UDP-N-acetylmuramate--L-alanine ligase [Denitrobacterium detoxificans]ANE22899.1 UDP-N-acetylmuramate--alanine ligase [Denitrobacterium detoxificans]SEO71035.1 UDP-N-acetylmuramate--L-alanine ligase [Denitrobacterium detoxificans]
MTQNQIERVHFIGVGGVGMSGIARVAHDQGMVVTGSDLKESRYTKQLEEAGITVFVGQAAENIPTDPLPDVVVVSTAIMENNPELVEAKRLGIPVVHRARMLAALGMGKKTLAVAGTHGKTTTSSMVASILDGMGADPTFLIGGIVRAYQTNAHSGSGEYYVVEADESDKSFTYLDPLGVLVTNVEADHLDHYSDLDEIYAKFAEFMASVPEEGVVVVCDEEHELVELARGTGRRVITYGQTKTADVKILSWGASGVGSIFVLQMPDGTTVQGRVKQNPGRHNVLNAAGALSLLWGVGEDVQAAADALAEFAGVRRRFDLVGEANGVTIVDDYAHHPTEIAATISAARKLDFNAVHVLFQPHRYSRLPLFTEVLRSDFAHAFDQADSVTFMDVYAAGEVPVPGVNGKTFMDVLEDSSDHPSLTYIHHRLDVVPSLVERVKPGDLVITMGAGDVTAMGPSLLAALQDKANA